MATATARIRCFDARVPALPCGLEGEVTLGHAHSAVGLLDDGHGLVALTPGRPLVPWGVILPAEADLPAVGARLALARDRLAITRADGFRREYLLEGQGQDLYVPFKEEGEDEGLFDAEGQDRASLAALWAALPDRTRQLLAARPIGPIRPFDRAAPTFEQLELSRLSSSLEELSSSVLTFSPACEARLATEVRRLVGLGRGSTPAGDDLLVGVAAAARALGLRGARALCDCLSALPARATTPAGGAMLREAGAGFFPAPLGRACRALPAVARDACRALAALGATSGADMLAGFLAVLRSREVPHG